MFKLSILTPEKRMLTDEEIDEVILPGDRGQLDVMPGHAPLLTTLRAGVVRYRLKSDSRLHALAVSWGYAEVNPEGVIILAETAETAAEIDRARAEASLKHSFTELGNVQADPDAIEKYQRKIEAAQARLDLVDDKMSH